ncbi:MAG: hypothetical protein O3A51_05295 [Verrucomicrobia bacterium]|nr:hypothetical protein [Verrucomicrobiota bacterium]
MKKIMPFALIATFCGALTMPQARADSWDEALRGGLVGAAVGAIVGHNSSDLDTAVAIPAFAAAGALLGYAYDQYDGDADSRYWVSDPYDSPRYRRHYRNRGYRYDHRSSGLHYGYPYSARRYYRVQRPAPVRPPVIVPKQEAPVVAPPNRHPGVTLIKIPITTAAGLTLDINVLKVGNQFVGPQAERYESLPTAEQLAERYAP